MGYYGGGSGGVQQMAPTWLKPGETFSVPENQQSIYSMRVDNEGLMALDGYLVEV